MASGRVGTRQEWAASAGVLERVKEHTRMGDELARQRRELPWVQVEKQYTLRTRRHGLVLARPIFERTVNYRSAAIYACPCLVTDPAERLTKLRCITERIAPGQWNHAR